MTLGLAPGNQYVLPLTASLHPSTQPKTPLGRLSLGAFQPKPPTQLLRSSQGTHPGKHHDGVPWIDTSTPGPCKNCHPPPCSHLEEEKGIQVGQWLCINTEVHSRPATQHVNHTSVGQESGSCISPQCLHWGDSATPPTGLSEVRPILLCPTKVQREREGWGQVTPRQKLCPPRVPVSYSLGTGLSDMEIQPLCLSMVSLSGEG